MSHFSVLVIGNEVEKQLAPFQENNMDDCPEQYLKWSGKDGYYDTKEEAIASYGAEADEDDIYQENPNRKWDWYEIGGRWTGFLKLKDGASGIIGTAGTMTSPAEPGHADQARKKDVDFDFMRDAAEKRAAETYDMAMSLFGDTLKDFIPWEKMWDVTHKENIDAARDAYHAQPATQALRKTDDKRFWFKSPEDFMCSREAYLQQARDGAITTYAVVKDSVWYEKGSMGWWGVSINEMNDTEWDRKFNELIDSLPDDTLLTIVDCHI